MHAHFALDAAFALPLCKLLRIPLIVSIHGYDITYSDATFRATAGGRLLLRRRKSLMERTSLFLCISEFIREKAIECGYPREKLWVNPTGIDLDSFQPDTVAARENLVLFVGRLVEKKGCIHLIRAMRSVQRRCPSANLVVIGDGPLRDELEKLAAAILPGQYAFLGAQPVEEVLAWLRRARVFSVPSITAANGNAEGLGMVFCEAQAMGVPVVSFDSGGIAEAVIHGETGFLVTEKDEASLADRISELLEDSPLWQEMSWKGQLRMKERFDLKAQTEILEAKYVEVLAAAS
jgi:glycosyltransferase involved in cell wall biosynthesis